MNNKIVISFSGGMDSATLLGHYIDLGYEVHPVIFTYGSKHNKYENQAAIRICKYFNIDYKFIDLSYINQCFKSDLLNSGGDIPEGHYEEASMERTVVPGRNIIFIANMVGYAWSIEAQNIAIGVHAGDHRIYADCRTEFIKAMDTAIYLGSDNRVQLLAPFLKLNKSEILNIGYNLKRISIPYEFTRTCYKDQELSCGKCGSCTERLEAFDIINKIDPIQYEKK